MRDPVKHKETIRRCHQEQRARTRRILASAKITAGCTDCGYAERHEALDFDHILPGKRNTVNQLVNRGYGVVWREVDLCEVVCSNCHRIRTADRLRAQRLTAHTAKGNESV